LLEYRSQTSHYYNRHLPGAGLLVWHVSFSQFINKNNHEKKKLVDLVCADDFYRDNGYVLGAGSDPDPLQGRDNLDFYTFDKHQSYHDLHQGNGGDATDPFDGSQYIHLDATSNPSSRFGGGPSAAATGVSLQLRRQGDAVIADITLPRWAAS
jgi:hypothetical protein